MTLEMASFWLGFEGTGFTFATCFSLIVFLEQLMASRLCSECGKRAYLSG